jgi:putative transposase
MLEGIIYRYRCGIAWRDLPAVVGPSQTVWTWHRRLATEGTWDSIVQSLIAQADAEGLVDWSVSVDSTITRAHQHATNTSRPTGGCIELESPHRGLYRITRIRASSRLIMLSAAPGAACRRRSTSSLTGRGCRWSR